MTTPIESLLAEQRSRLRRRFLLHGSGWIIAAVVLCLFAHLLLDRALDLPVAPRLVLTAAVLAYLVAGVRRRLLYALDRRFAMRDIALLVERNNPELRQALVSAVEFEPQIARGTISGSATLAAEVVARAETEITRLDLGPLLRATRTLRLWGIAVASLLLVASIIKLSPTTFSNDALAVWGRRLWGASEAYPRSTYLELAIPRDQGNYRIRDEGPTIHVDLALGSELPINVLVEGRVPNRVNLHLEALGASGSRSLPMSRRGDARFRHVLRRVLTPLRIWASGGDDPGTASVEVHILRPPAATALSCSVVPPPYSGLAPSLTEGGVVRALPGSDVEIRLRSTEPLTEGKLHFQESGLIVELIEVAAAGVDDGGDAVAVTTPYRATFKMPEKLDRYRIRLSAVNGLSERETGLHAVLPTPDRPPQVRVLAPTGSLAELTPGSAFPLRIVASDDFGLESLSLRSVIGEAEHVISLWRFEGEGARPPAKIPVVRLLDPSQTRPAGERRTREGDRLSFELHATDNREPDAQASRNETFRIDLVDVDELRRRLQSRLRATRRTVEVAHRTQTELSTRLATFLGSVEEGEPLQRAARRLFLAAGEAGEQRVRASLERVRADFVGHLDAHLFNGLDAAPAAIEARQAWLAYFAKNPEVSATSPAFWLELDASRRSGAIGRLDVLARLLDMLVLGDRLVTGPLKAALSAIAKASTLESDDEFVGSLRELGTAQKATITGIERLLYLLDDWNDYQDVVLMTRRLKDSERELMHRLENKEKRGGAIPGGRK